MRESRRFRGERGQAVPVLAAVVVLVGVVGLVIGHLGGAAVARARAGTAADAAAWAGAVEGRSAAAAVATANGAVIERYVEDGHEVEVVVRVGAARARARARATGSRVAAELAQPRGGGDRGELAPALVAALARADDELGRPVPVTGGRGLVVQVDEAVADELASVAVATGLCRIDLVDFAPCPMSSAE